MSVILRFKAGKVDYDEETHLCTPKPIKGEITIKKSEDDESFYDFVWSPREKVAGGAAGDAEEDELLIIPGDVEWKHVKSAKSGRVFCLSFCSSLKSFYWLQDKNDNEDDPSELSAKDKSISEQIQKLIAEEDDEEDDDEDDDDDEDEEPAHNDVDGDESMADVSKTEPPTQKPIVSISSVFTSSVVADFVNNKLSAAKVDEYLSTFLPEGYFEAGELESLSDMEKRQELINVLNSGFYRAAEGKLGSAIARGAGGVVSQAFHFDYNGEGIENFLDAVRKQGLKERKK